MAHVIELFASEDAGCRFAADYDIPCGYDADTLVALPVDAGNSFLYWEISRATLAALENRFGPEPLELAAAVFELRDDGMALLDAFHVENTSGRRYVKRRGTMLSPLTAVIGVLKDDEFHDVLISRTLPAPSFTITGNMPLMWLEKLRDAMDALKVHPPAVLDDTSREIARRMGFDVDAPDELKKRLALSSGMIFGGRGKK
jgi:hypothetical protein